MLGGDCDTLGWIADGTAEALYGVLDELKRECCERIALAMWEFLERHDRKRACKEWENVE